MNSSDVRVSNSSTLLNDVLAEQVVKNLVFLGQCMWYHPSLCRDDDTEDGEDGEKFHPIRWILKRMSVLARPGLGIISNVSSLRQQSALRFSAAIAMTLPVEGTKSFFSIVLSPIVSIVSAADREDAAQLTSKVRTKKKRKRGAEEPVESEKDTSTRHCVFGS